MLNNNIAGLNMKKAEMLPCHVPTQSAAMYLALCIWILPHAINLTDLRSSDQKIGTLVTLALRNGHTNFAFSAHFWIQVRRVYASDKWTSIVMKPIRMVT